MEREMRQRLLTIGLAAAVILAATGGRAGADEPRFDNSNGVGFPTIANFGEVTLTGTQQLTAASMSPFVVVDDSGALAGWNVTLLLPNFRNGTGADCATNSTASVPATSISMNPPVIEAANAQTDLTGVTGHGWTDFTSARKIVTASAGHGDGTYRILPQVLKLTVPATTRADTYCTLATIAITSGP